MSKKDALGADDWIRAGFRALVVEGAVGLRAEALARALGISKGSFYWHFQDVPAFKCAMLAHWHEAATRRVVADIRARSVTGAAALDLLAGFAGSAPDAYGGTAAEGAVREWARFDSTARDTVRRVDAERIGFVAECFAAEGIHGADARARAELFYAAFIGLEHLSTQAGTPVEPRLKRLVRMLLSARGAGEA